jgi:protein SCO1/2
MSKKILKVGILVLVLVLPAFFFIVAHLFGENQFGLPRYAPLGLKTEVSKGFVFGDSSYHQVEDFDFQDQDSSNFSFYDSKEQIKVVSLIFTSCKNECPQIISNLTRLSSVYKNDKDISLLTITVDPQSDLPSVLKTYRALFEIDNPNWKFLTSNQSNLYQYLKTQLFLSSEEPVDSNLAFFHTQKVVLVDKNNVIRGYYDATKLENVDDLIGAIKILKTDYE